MSILYPSLTWQALYQPRRRFPSNPPQHLDINICFRRPGRQSSKGALLVRRPPITTSNQEHEFRFQLPSIRSLHILTLSVISLDHRAWCCTCLTLCGQERLPLPCLPVRRLHTKWNIIFMRLTSIAFFFLGESTVFTCKFSVVSCSLVFPF